MTASHWGCNWCGYFNQRPFHWAWRVTSKHSRIPQNDLKFVFSWSLPQFFPKLEWNVFLFHKLGRQRYAFSISRHRSILLDDRTVSLPSRWKPTQNASAVKLLIIIPLLRWSKTRTSHLGKGHVNLQALSHLDIPLKAGNEHRRVQDISSALCASEWFWVSREWEWLALRFRRY